MSSRNIGNFRLREKIGGGSFGKIYRADNVILGTEVAIKIESSSIQFPQLVKESKFYRHVAGAVGFPEHFYYGAEGDNSVMAMELLGPSLADLLQHFHGRFSLKTVLMLADQMFARIEYVHTKGFIHRDIKPDNFAIGYGKKNQILYLIDFGLSRRYIDPKTGQHIPYHERRDLTGTARYSSIPTHLGIEQSRRDDVESLCYVLIYMLKGRLPWQGLKAETQKKKNMMISEIKCTTSIDQLCDGLPREFSLILEDVKQLGFQDTPNYSKYRQLLRDVFIREGYVYDSVYDWSTKRDDMISHHQAIPHIIYPSGPQKLVRFRSNPQLYTPKIPQKPSTKKSFPLPPIL